MAGSDSTDTLPSGTDTEMPFSQSQFDTLMLSLTKLTSRFDRMEKDLYDSEDGSEDAYYDNLASGLGARKELLRKQQLSGSGSVHDDGPRKKEENRIR